MTVADNIHQYVQKLPDFLQLEVLDNGQDFCPDTLYLDSQSLSDIPPER